MKNINPKLANRPVIILSNNDGCAVARSEEAKAIGIQMGAPAFKIRHLINAHQVAVFSFNYALYRDMSRRFMQTLSRFTDQIEIYSIDKAFLDLSDFTQDTLADHGQQIAATVQQWTGIPVFIGIAPSKTLAKFASRPAKKSTIKTRNLSRRVLKLTDTPELIYYAVQCLRQIYKTGIQFKKAGIIFKDLVCASPIQTGLFDTRNRKRSQNLIRFIDTINAEMGSNTIKYAAAGLIPGQKWQPLSRQRSPAYTTHWNHLPKAS